MIIDFQKLPSKLIPILPLYLESTYDILWHNWVLVCELQLVLKLSLTLIFSQCLFFQARGVSLQNNFTLHWDAELHTRRASCDTISRRQPCSSRCLLCRVYGDSGSKSCILLGHWIQNQRHPFAGSAPNCFQCQLLRDSWDGNHGLLQKRLSISFLSQARRRRGRNIDCATIRELLNFQDPVAYIKWKL